MKIYNTLYKDNLALQKFVDEYNIAKEESVLVQIFSGVIDADFCLSLAQFLQNILPHANIIGTTSAGEIMNGEMYDEEVVLSFTLFSKTKVASQLYSLENDFDMVAMHEELVSEDTKAMVIFSDGLHSDAETLLQEIHEATNGVVIAGGRAGDDNFKETFVFTPQGYSDNGCAIATLSGDSLIVNSDYILKWTPIGKEMTVTKADNTILYELDGIPIIDVYRKYLGDDVVKNLPASCMAFPLLLKKDKIVVARDPVAVINEKALMYAGKFEVGESVRFSFANIEELTDNLDAFYDQLKDYSAEAIYIYSCAARKALLEDKLRDELSILDAIAPSAGFFTFGEFLQSTRVAELLNVTTTFMLLSESHQKQRKRLEHIPFRDFDPIKKALTHLVKVTTAELETLSTHDSLTGLYNRNEYIRVINKKIKSAQRYGEHFGMIILDLDFFKLVNDNYGHDVGDKVLQKVAKIVEENVREDDFVARWGGEEFIIIAKNATIDALEKLARKLQKKMQKASFAPVPKVTLSFGLTVYKDGDDEEELFKRVDNALYTAKQNGRNQYIIG